MPYLLRLKNVLAAQPTRLIISCPTSQIDLYGTPITCKNKFNFSLNQVQPYRKGNFICISSTLPSAG